MSARKWVERAANRGGNINPASLGSMLFGVLSEGGVPAAMAFRLAMDQNMMSRFAISLEGGSKIMKEVSRVGKSASLVGFQVGRMQMEE